MRNTNNTCGNVGKFGNIVMCCSTGSRDIHLLEQKVPASYVKLQDVIRHIAEERKQENKSPVLSTTQYR